MKVVLFTDTHFGLRNGSQTWFRHQSDFMECQLIPRIQELKAKEPVMVVHLGDVFDSRSSLPTMIAAEVRDLFARLAGVGDGLWVIPGNHDYYSEQTDAYCTPKLALNNIPGLTLVEAETEVEWAGRKCILYPWPDQKKVSPATWTSTHPGTVLLTHSDILTGNPRLAVPVFSGHIHTPYIQGNIRNLGSCYPIDFHDCNQERYFYIWDPATDELQKEANRYAIRFWRLYGEEIKGAGPGNYGPDDYMELYIPSNQFMEYQDIIEQFKKRLRNLWVIPTFEGGTEGPVDVSLDMESIIAQAIPDHLREKFEQVKARIQPPEE